MVATAADFEPQIRLALRRWSSHPAVDDFHQEARLALHKARVRGAELTPGLAYTIAKRSAIDAYRAYKCRLNTVALVTDPPCDPVAAMADRAEELLALPALQDVIAQHCQRALDLAAGNITVAAEVLGIGRATLYRWLKSRVVSRPSEGRAGLPRSTVPKAS